MKLSVCCLAYNHGQFIARALDGFLMQQTNFQFEVIISDDCSSDNTRAICIACQQKHPEIIKLVLHDTNVGMMENFAGALKNCSGDYVAICEGDDYWIDANKLQKQVDFLDNNPSYAICFHRVYELVQNKQVLSDLNVDETEKDYSIHDLALGNFIHTPSVVFRRKFFDEFPPWYASSPLGDYLLYMVVAKNGPIKYLPALMAVYRRHDNGVWSVVGLNSRVEKTISLINMLLGEDFTPDVKAQLIKQRLNLKNLVLKPLLKQSSLDEFLQKLDAYSQDDPALVKTWLLHHYPKYIKSLRNKINKLEGKNTLAGITSGVMSKLRSAITKRK